MIHVPAGESWFGDADEALRTQFLNTVPIHRRRVDAFLIARHETTYAEWIAFLDDLPAAERPKYTPGRSQGIHGFLSLQRTGTSWQLTLQPMTRRQTARAGEDFVYAGRSRRARQDWLHFPVAAVSTPQIERYLSWLDGTGRVPGARFCTDLEWERAARGADDRSFPHGDILAPDDANFDATYGQVDAAFGPDIVGSHPASRSPFGVDDLAGNVLELVRSSLRPHDMALRSGAYFYSPMTARSTNREVVPASFRDIRAGVRVCASITPGR
jgi:formylglycine-generating enzyme required for sulfatase activity